MNTADYQWDDLVGPAQFFVPVTEFNFAVFAVSLHRLKLAQVKTYSTRPRPVHFRRRFPRFWRTAGRLADLTINRGEIE
jgi:hypothetical protein